MIRIKTRRYDDLYTAYVNPAAIAAVVIPDDHRCVTVKLISGETLVAVEFDELLDFVDATLVYWQDERAEAVRNLAGCCVRNPASRRGLRPYEK